MWIPGPMYRAVTLFAMREGFCRGVKTDDLEGFGNSLPI